MADSIVSIRVIGAGGSLPQAPGAPRAPGSSASPAAPQQAAAVAAEAAATAVTRETRKTAASGPAEGKSLGLQLGTLALGIGAHQVFSAGVSALATVPGQRRNANILGTVGGGAIAGAMAGSALGPPGMVVGAVIAGAASALKALAEEAKNTRDAIKATRLTVEGTRTSMGMRRQDEAFRLSLGTMGRQERIGVIRQRMDDLNDSRYGLSIENLQRSMRKFEKAGKTDDPEYKKQQGLLQTQLGRFASLQELLDQTARQAIPKPLEASAVTDRLGAMGGSVGPQVDVDSVNQQILDVSRQMLDAIRRLGELTTADANTATKSAGPIGLFVLQ